MTTEHLFSGRRRFVQLLQQRNNNNKPDEMTIFCDEHALPIEIITTIISFLDAFTLLNDASLVSKKWFTYARSSQAWKGKHVLLDSLQDGNTIPEPAMKLFVNCRVSHFRVSDHRWLIPVLHQQRDVIEDLILYGYDDADEANTTWEEGLTFPLLKKIEMVTIREGITAEVLLANLLGRSPSLEYLSFAFTPDNQFVLECLILNLKKLKSLKVTMGVGDDFLLRLFSNLDLELLSIPNYNWSPDLWSRLSKLPRFSKLKALLFSATGDDSAQFQRNPKATTVQYQIFPNNIEELTCNAWFPYCRSILQSCLTTLKKLSINDVRLFNDYKFFQNLPRMNLWSLYTDGVSAKLIENLIRSSASTLRSIEITRTQDDFIASTAPSIHFPLLKRFHYSASNSFLFLLFGSTSPELDSFHLHDLTCNVNEVAQLLSVCKKLFENWILVRQFYSSLSVFQCLPSSVLSTISELSMRSLLLSDNPIDANMDNLIFHKLLDCKSVKELDLSYVKSINADFVYARILNQMPDIRWLTAEHTRFIGHQVLNEQLNQDSNLLIAAFDISFMSLNDWSYMFKRLPHVKSISSGYPITMDAFSHLLHLTTLKGRMTNLMLHISDSAPKCHYLNTKLSIIMLTIDCTSMSMDDILLLWICTTTETTVQSYGYTQLILQNEQYLKMDQSVNTAVELIRMIRALVPKVVERILGIGEAKRQELIDMYTDSSSEILDKFYFAVAAATGLE